MADAFKRTLGIPMGDLSQFRKRPVATLAIIIVNIAIYAITSYENFFLEVSDYWVSAGGFVPALTPMPAQWYRVFSSMFLHADFFHILFNMYFLYIFGRAVEEALGKWRFLALYMVSGAVASIFHTAFSFLGGATAYVIPAIGASGAISGVLGAYLILFPGTSLVMGWGFLFFPIFFRLKAAYYLIFWFATQVIYGYARLGGSTAVFAHAGGFMAGIALLPFVVSKERSAQFKLAYQAILPPHLTFAPSTRTRGLGRITKIILAALLVSLLFGAAYASTGLSTPKEEIKSTVVQYTYNGNLYVDYVGFQLPEVGAQISEISLDETRILLNRLYWAGMLYNKGKNDTEANETYKGELQVNVTVTIYDYEIVIPKNVPTTINLTGKYDKDGFLAKAEGVLETYIIRVNVTRAPPPYWYFYNLTLVGPVSYSFRLESQTVNLSEVTRYAGVGSLIVTAAALFITIKRDEELVLVGEEPERIWRPFTPVV